MSSYIGESKLVQTAVTIAPGGGRVSIPPQAKYLIQKIGEYSGSIMRDLDRMPASVYSTRMDLLRRFTRDFNAISDSLII